MSASDDSDQGSAGRMLSKASVLTEDQKKVCNRYCIFVKHKELTSIGPPHCLRTKKKRKYQIRV